MRAVLLFAPLIILCACVQMRDHAAKRNGAFTLFSTTPFGEGEVSKDYYLVTPETALIVGDTKNEIVRKIGLPDEIVRRGDGVEAWRYKAHALELQFKGETMAVWKKITTAR